MAIPSRASRPILDISYAIKPNTATGASSIALFTMVMQTFCSDPINYRIGRALSALVISRAIPKITEKKHYLQHLAFHNGIERVS